MTYERDAKAKAKTGAVVDLAEIRTARTLARTQARLLPEITDHLAAEDLSRRVAAQLAALPVGERNLLRRDVVVAVHDLEALVASLRTELSDLVDELRTVSSHSGAATAYGRAARPSENRP